MLISRFVFLLPLISFILPANGNELKDNAAEQKISVTQKLNITKNKSISLTSLNRYVNKWYILSVDGTESFSMHIQNRDPGSMLSLTQTGISFSREENKQLPGYQCELWSDAALKRLQMQMRSFAETYLPLCDNRLYIRMSRPANTQLSLTESATNLLRKTEFGENFINTFKPYLVSIMSESASDGEAFANIQAQKVELLDTPLEPKMHITDNMRYDDEHHLGIELESGHKAVEYGKWYETKMHAGIFVGIFKPELIHPDVIEIDRKKANKILDSEKDMRIYMTAYDLNMYAPEYTIGTQEPKISNPDFKDKLVPIGSIPPYDLSQSVGVFIGGFKTRHSTMTRGPHKGKTYGFIEKGVELAKMSAGLATAYLKKDGSFHIDKWPEQKKMQLDLSKEIVAARQNGVMLIDDYAIGNYVNNWGYGNWSGSAERSLKTMRSGICLQEKDHKRYLLFMAFTAATPSTMAQTMQAFHCKTAMHLDMNAYMYMHNAIYSYEPEKGYNVQYLNTHMKYPKSIKRHRYIMDNNSRDFFYLKRRQTNNTNYLGTN